MILFEAAPSSPGPRGARHILDEIDRRIAAGWVDDKPAIAALVAELACDDVLMRAFLRSYCDVPAWPVLTGAQSFVFMTTDSMFVRLNLWFPPDDPAAPLDTYRRYLSIDELHNHDFQFFTACLYGPGYTTSFFHDEGHHSGRRQGEKVELAAGDSLHLGRGPVMYVESGKDYHMQHWPSALSVTVNVVPRDYERGDRIQYVLDADHVVKTVIDSTT